MAKTANEGENAEILWKLVSQIRASNRFLNHDLRSILGRGIGWARLIPPTLSQKPASSLNGLQDFLEIVGNIQSSLEKSLGALDEHNKNARDKLKVRWIVVLEDRAFKATNRDEWMIFSDLSPAQILEARYRPDALEIPKRAVDDRIQKLISSFENFGTEIVYL